MTEREIMNRIHMTIGSREDARLFRNNLGKAWVARGKPVRTDGGVFLPHGQQYQFGLPPGSPDLVGIKMIRVSPDMVGRTVGLFLGIEVKVPGGRVQTDQRRFLEMIKRFGGVSGVAWSIEEAMKVFSAEQSAQRIIEEVKK